MKYSRNIVPVDNPRWYKILTKTYLRERNQSMPIDQNRFGDERWNFLMNHMVKYHFQSDILHGLSWNDILSLLMTSKSTYHAIMPLLKMDRTKRDFNIYWYHKYFLNVFKCHHYLIYSWRPANYDLTFYPPSLKQHFELKLITPLWYGNIEQHLPDPIILSKYKFLSVCAEIHKDKETMLDEQLYGMQKSHRNKRNRKCHKKLFRKMIEKVVETATIDKIKSNKSHSKFNQNKPFRFKPHMNKHRGNQFRKRYR